MTVRILIGDVRDKLAELADESVHCVVTSPPYWGLRDYGVEGQIGLEATPDKYIATMVSVFREARRVLRADGTLWLNMGDSYASTGGERDYGSYDGKTGRGPGARRWRPGSGRADGVVDERAQRNRDGVHAPGLKPKDLCMMPARLALALQADGWWLRSEIIWAKPNPMPESITDRPTSAHEKVYLLTKSARYFYDAEAVREKCESGPSDIKKMMEGLPRIGGKHKTLEDPLSKASATTNIGQKRSVGDPSGRNLRNVWDIATAPFPEAHFATFPPALVEPCIKAGTSERGCCPECGAPWVRETKTAYVNPGNRTTNGPRSIENREQTAGFQTRLEKSVSTLGWSPSCECLIFEDENEAAEWGANENGPQNPLPCTVLDPFAGSGTTGLVADRLGRDAILIELNPEYAAMAKKRLHADAGMFAEVESR